ncbi:MAG TPA: curli assembly protein CsgG, partial [Verrucomicrobiae bacterium]|nr:curli assembly protein CsgG [Verrucomicrobiae bacterium]
SMASESRPVISVSISERHFSGPTIDPAAETELAKIAGDCGFKLTDNKSEVKAQIEITGEALSEFGMRKGNLVSCKARIELKVRETATGNLLIVDRQTSVAVDLTEQIAAKSALQNAAAELAERILPKLAR